MCIFKYNRLNLPVFFYDCHKNNDLFTFILYMEYCRHDVEIYKNRTCIKNRGNQGRRHDRGIHSHLLREKGKNASDTFAMATTDIIVIPRAAARSRF